MNKSAKVQFSEKYNALCKGIQDQALKATDKLLPEVYRSIKFEELYRLYRDGQEDGRINLFKYMVDLVRDNKDKSIEQILTENNDSFREHIQIKASTVINERFPRIKNKDKKAKLNQFYRYALYDGLRWRLIHTAFKKNTSCLRR
jgi:hypothetical protein